MLVWARELDAPITPAPTALRMAPRPDPAPPVALRPIELPVTAIETWVRDPYAVYARYILRLRQIERPRRAGGGPRPRHSGPRRL